MNRLEILLVAAAATIAPAVSGADSEPTMSGPYAPQVRSVQILPTDPTGRTYEGPAVIDLEGRNRVAISFDILSEDRDYLRYELTHCDAMWRPSGLVDPEYIDGFNQAEVTDYAFSQGTSAHYVNYRIAIPNDDIRPTIAGNYILRVYPEEAPDSTLLIARFGVTESSAPVRAECTSRTDFDVNGSHQQLSVSVDTKHLPIINPYGDLRVVVEQNGRTDNAVVVSQPLRVEGSNVFFEHSRDLTFDAGNEYRRFETVSYLMPGMGVEQIDYSYPFYHHTLYTDTPRANTFYSYDLARSGRYLVRAENCTDPDTQADYSVVHFTLASPELRDYNIFVEGDLTDRRINGESMMTYDRNAGVYRATLLLKQGAYSYQYLAVPKTAASHPSGTTAPIEGDYYETQNNYTVKVYYRAPGERFDRLAGVTTLKFPD